jgi:hypothetical protein
LHCKPEVLNESAKTVENQEDYSMHTRHKLSLKSLLFVFLALVLSSAAIWQLNANVSAHAVSANGKRTVAGAKQQTVSGKVSTRVEEITAALRLLAEQAEKSGKTPAIVEQIEALEAELAGIQAGSGPTATVSGPTPTVVSGPTPTVTAETEPNNTSATANVINLSAQPCAVVSAAINPGGDIDFFTFTGAPAGSRIWIETDTGGTQNAGATSRDTVIDLLAADGTTVIENDDDDGTGNGGDGSIETGLASMIGGRTLTTGGTYFIRVRAFSATAVIDPYRLFVTLTNVAATPEVEANNTAATANSIVTAGTPIGLASGAIGVAGDSDYYSVVAAVGNIVYFNVDADPERDGTGTDLVVELRDPADVLLLSVDSSITGSLANPAAEGANFTITTAGTYFVRVRHFSATGTGTYHVMVSACSGDPIGGGGCTSIACPANVTQGNDPSQCGAVVNYPAPTTTGTCGTITCVPASGSFFPVGTTTVTCTSTAGPQCSFTVTVNDTQPPTITCPANITVSNDPNQCGAVVNYPAPTVSDNCPGVGAPICAPASGSFFPRGTTTVTCNVADFAANSASCTFTITVNDTQPPTITCPANITAVTDQSICAQPGTPICQVVTFTTPIPTDNCPGTTVACVPPSGTCFNVGVTTVTCTATDASGNTATCSFTITTFDVVLQDDSDPTTVLLWNSITGQYRFCFHGTTYTGVGKVQRQGCVFLLDHTFATDRRVLGRVDKAVHAGTASLQAPPGTLRCTIQDRNTLNDTPVCQ